MTERPSRASLAAYALELERGASPADALTAALDMGGWEPSPG